MCCGVARTFSVGGGGTDHHFFTLTACISRGSEKLHLDVLKLCILMHDRAYLVLLIIKEPYSICVCIFSFFLVRRGRGAWGTPEAPLAMQQMPQTLSLVLQTTIYHSLQNQWQIILSVDAFQKECVLRARRASMVLNFIYIKKRIIRSTLHPSCSIKKGKFVSITLYSMDIWDVPLIPVWDLYILSEYGHLRCTTHTSLRPVHTFRVWTFEMYHSYQSETCTYFQSMDIWDVPLIPVWDLYILSEYGHLRCTTHTSLRPVHTFRVWTFEMYHSYQSETCTYFQSLDIWDVPLIPVWDLYILSEYGHLRCTTHTSLRPVHTRGIYTIIQTRQKMPNRSLAAMLPRATTHYRHKCQFQNIPNRSVIFWRVLACLASINARGCNIAMLGDVTSGAELDVYLKKMIERYIHRIT